MDSFVCRIVTALVVVSLSIPAMWGQTAILLDWQRVGSTVMDLSLASPAGGPVDRVWYSADGSRFFARTQVGRVWQTADFESWQPANGVEVPERSSPLTGPGGAFAISHPLRATRAFAVGQFAYRSDDGGLNWANLTNAGGHSILGDRLVDAAISPRNPDEIIVAGANGLWRSLDAGDSWLGMNDAFPNLPVQRIIPSKTDDDIVRIVATGAGEFVWNAGERVAWRPAGSSALTDEEKLKGSAAAVLGTNITAAAGSANALYTGSADGVLYFSRDGGANWGTSGVVAGAGRVVRIRIDAADPNTAVAITDSRLRGRVLKSSSGGVFWEDLTGNLPASVAVKGVAYDRASTAIYIATDRGLYYAYTESGAPAWVLLRAGAATDVSLDANGNQLLAAFADAGVFSALAPHRLRDPRVVSSADRIARAAAPGSLLSVIGARVQNARIGDRNAPVLAASDLESQIQVPFDTAAGSMQLAASTPSGNRQLGLTVLPAAPSIFVDRDGVPLVMNAETGLVLDPNTPARSGARLQVLATGLGRVQPDWPTGLPAPLENAPRVIAPVRAYLDREPVEVKHSTLAPGFVGMYVVEIQVPSIVNRGTAELYIEVQDQQSNRIRIFLEP